ncbi:MAG: asparagine synthase (glutamine-hydrolyzing) [Desulfuromonadales bacterium]|nr:MAG: asparagine synthase (glutamine-hydrolyzing) [Desulfuromonadales bacterium]
MCGIAGILNTHNAAVSEPLLDEMTRSLAHRGPDGSGIEISGPVGFGHRRLSIIDPAGGRQPMFNEDGRVWVTFNGEIYNYRELRAELQGKGHRFVSNSDTETIVHAYEEWGERCVERFRGMFAFAVADHREGKIFLARDHFGIKPLYYLQEGGVFAFASEVQALRKLPGIPWSLDLTAMDQYLWLQYIPAPRTAFEQVRKLPPAHRMTIHFDGRTTGPEQYWELQFRPDYNRSEQEWIEALDEAMADSVRAHLVSDVPFGAFLSGGVDSSLILGYMTRILNRPVKAFSIGFEEPEFNETPYARFAAERWGADHHIEIVKPDALAILPDLVRCYGDLFGDSSAIPTYYVSQVARRNVPMVLSGDGADELFAGYWSHGDWLNSFQQDRSIRPSLAHWLSFINYADTGRRLSLWRDEYRDVCPAPQETFERAYATARPFSPCHKAQFLDVKTYMTYDILTKVDIASMMHGLEVRPPFVDVKVAELAASVPEQFGIGKNLRGEWERKLLLKKVGEKYFPPEFLHRPKMGFAIPLTKWFAPSGHLHDILRQRLTGSGSTLLEFFNPAAMQELISANATGPLWLLLFCEEWLRQNRQTPQPAGIARTPEIRSEPLRVRILYDVEGWAWWHRAHRIREGVSSRIRVDIHQMDEPFDHEPYDFVMIFDPYLVDRVAGVPAAKLIVGCSCPRFLDHAEALLQSHRCIGGVVNSREMYNRATTKERLFCCQNGVDTELFHPPRKRPSKLTGCWIGNSDSAGNKGLDLITAACREAGAELIVLDRNAAKGTAGLMSQEEVRDRFYHKASFYLCASEWEGTPNPALEALACGLPVISTRVGNMPELIVDGHNGYLVDRSVASIAEAISKLAAADRPAMARNARTSVENGWSWQQQAAKYEAMFLKLSETAAAKKRAAFTNEMGEELFRRGDQNGALALFSRAIEIDRECAEAWNNLGVIFSQHGDTANALTYLSTALTMAPENGTYIVNTSQVLRAAGRGDEARNLCVGFLNARPNDHGVRSHLESFTAS